MRADEEVVQRAKQLQDSRPDLSFSAAKARVLEQDPELAARYVKGEDPKGPGANPVGEDLMVKIKAYQADHPHADFATAKRTVFELNPDLARSYTEPVTWGSK